MKLMLIIDDNVEFRTMVSDYFTDLEYTVEIALALERPSRPLPAISTVYSRSVK